MSTLTVLNTTAETIPPGGVVELVGTADEFGRVRVKKPTADSSLAVLVNGPTPIFPNAGGTGFLPWFGPLAAAVDPALLDGTTGGWVTPQVVLGSQAGSWLLHAGKTGFIVQADPLGGLVPVQAVAAAGAVRCGLPVMFRVQVGTSFTTTTAVVSGTTVLTGIIITQRFVDISIDENGCLTRGTPYCEVAGSTCAGSESPAVAYWCIGGVCWKVYDGITPTGGTGPFTTLALCATDCGAASAPTCSEVPPGTLPTSLPTTVGNTGQCPAPCSTAPSSGFGNLTRIGIGVDTWTADDDAGCGLTNTLTLQCSGGLYTLSVSNVWTGNPDYPTGGSYTPVSGTDSPFSLTFEISAHYICGPAGTGTIQVVVTE